MFENVSEHLDEAVRLAERCPEKYQIPCFEALIRVLAQSDSLPAQSAEDSHLLNGNGSNGSTNGGTTGVSSGSYNNPAFNSAPNNGQHSRANADPYLWISTKFLRRSSHGFIIWTATHIVLSSKT